MSALRARMNPHFIFNCLNSIKLYTLENDAQTASEYLSKFSRLIRRVLEDATAEKITVAKELETLQLYIELEAMRFKDKVRYSIRVDDGIDQDLVEIPPLLLQPYVENAIWHGLMHRPQGGAIEVAVTQPADNCLQVDITDNGIGRAAADALNSKSATRQKSFGLQMTAERIDILNQVYGMQAAVVVNDLTDNAGTASGTKVTMKIPLF
ncbi:MAG TPA: histidine kinase [Flavihumibacter sp.]|nr:histidine kinase [Flavihumibacter sp.]